MIEHFIDSIIHWAHWINWDGVLHTAFVLWAAILVLVELYLLDRSLERKMKGE